MWPRCYKKLTGHSDIFCPSEMSRGCVFSIHAALFLIHHTQACSYSMRRLWIPAFLFCVPDAHSVSGYPVFSTDAVSVFSFRISFPAFPDTRIRSHLHGSLLHFLRSHLQFFFPALCSGVSYMPIFPVTAQSCVPSGIFGFSPVCGTSGLFHWDD